jgi:enoyl-CoA hydratase/carnithine racemase
MAMVAVPALRVSAQEALSWGLVSRLVQPEQLLPEAHAIADKLARWGQQRPRSVYTCIVHVKCVSCNPLHCMRRAASEHGWLVLLARRPWLL